jgi:hypothetical protein
MEQLYTIQEIAKILRISPLSVRSLIECSELAAFSVGDGTLRRRVLIGEVSLQEYLDKNRIFCGK